jgi:NTP pyrophosphatase (non-canonical NTP hydrolase)
MKNGKKLVPEWVHKLSREIEKLAAENKKGNNAGLRVGLNSLAEIAHRQAKNSGFHEKLRTPLEYHALISSEIGEATEAYRRGVKPVEIRRGKPEGEAVELADVVIRIADYFGARGWDLGDVVLQKMGYNATRSYRHGGKIA